jgi:integrin beta 3
VHTVDTDDVIPSCSEYTEAGVWQWPLTEFRGALATTIFGRTCQKWTSVSPHSHGYHPDDDPSSSAATGTGDHNYCRDPDGTGYLWCYTTDPDHR